MTKKQVEKVLRQVKDPELNINVVDLGLIYQIATNNEQLATRVKIVMTLTTPGCPLGGWFVQEVKKAVANGLKIAEEQVMVEITFDPPWSQELMTEDVKAQLGF